MSAAERGASGCAGGARERGLSAGVLFGLFLALILRLVGFKTGPAVRLQRGRERHFVPRAIGMFGHG